MILANDAWPLLAGAAAACLLLAAGLVLWSGDARREGSPQPLRPGAEDRSRGRARRMLAALRLPALAAFGAFTVSAALDGIAALLPPEVPVVAQAPRDCAEVPTPRGGIAACDAAPEARPRD